MCDSNRTISPVLYKEYNHAPLSPSMDRELKEAMKRTRCYGDANMYTREAFPEQNNDLKGEALLEYKRKRNAFHSRKKRRRKQAFVARLETCYKRLSDENLQLQADHVVLKSQVENALAIAEYIEAAETRLQHEDCLPGRQLGSADPLQLTQAAPLHRPFQHVREVIPEVNRTTTASAVLKEQELAAAQERALILMGIAQRGSASDFLQGHQLRVSRDLYSPYRTNSDPLTFNLGVRPTLLSPSLSEIQATASMQQHPVAAALLDHQRRVAMETEIRAQAEIQAMKIKTRTPAELRAQAELQVRTEIRAQAEKQAEAELRAHTKIRAEAALQQQLVAELTQQRHVQEALLFEHSSLQNQIYAPKSW